MITGVTGGMRRNHLETSKGRPRASGSGAKGLRPVALIPTVGVGG